MNPHVRAHSAQLHSISSTPLTFTPSPSLSPVDFCEPFDLASTLHHCDNGSFANQSIEEDASFQKHPLCLAEQPRSTPRREKKLRSTSASLPDVISAKVETSSIANQGNEQIPPAQQKEFYLEVKQHQQTLQHATMEEKIYTPKPRLSKTASLNRVESRKGASHPTHSRRQSSTSQQPGQSSRNKLSGHTDSQKLSSSRYSPEPRLFPLLRDPSLAQEPIPSVMSLQNSSGYLENNFLAGPLVSSSSSSPILMENQSNLWRPQYATSQNTPSLDEKDITEELLDSRKTGLQNASQRDIKSPVDYKQRHLKYIEEAAIMARSKSQTQDRGVHVTETEKKKMREKMGLHKVRSRFQNIPEAPYREQLISEELQHKLSQEERSKINFRIMIRQNRFLQGMYSKGTLDDSIDDQSSITFDEPGGTFRESENGCEKDDALPQDAPCEVVSKYIPVSGDDIAYWKKRCELADNIKVFIINGTYEDIRTELIQRGWVENPDPTSCVFDFKWTTYSNDINFRKLNKKQVVNHFEGVDVLTTKLGLLKSLRQLFWLESQDYQSFYPRSYDLSDASDLKDFLDDFRLTTALNLIKLVVKARGNLATVIGVDSDLSEQYSSQKSGYWTKLRRYLIHLACRACEYDIERKSLGDEFPEEIAMDLERRKIYNLSEREWDLLLSVSARGWKFQKDAMDAIQSIKEIQSNAKVPTRSKPTNSISTDPMMDVPNERKLYIKCLEIHEIMACSRQFEMSGMKGVWIVKPSGSSKGFGVRCLTDLKSILLGRTENARIVQKYIENPLLIKGRKFDIRQWVLVTSWEPLTIWFYEDCVLRFATESFNLDDPENRYVHLCNYSVQKQNDKGAPQDGAELSWTSEEFVSYLKQENGDDFLWVGMAKPAMKDIISWAFRCCQSQVHSRPNTFELYGVDFIIDEYGYPWLIEVNASPGLRASPTLAGQMLKDIVKVVIDSPPIDHEHASFSSKSTPIELERTGMHLYHMFRHADERISLISLFMFFLNKSYPTLFNWTHNSRKKEELFADPSPFFDPITL
eukprot:TRINITY_DN3009_c1_g1_i2.p1 TRINITY_DN3009_c1_g1~~TRINITY_DN3009_c1_g1_i2.p1  ORF type:complete len:1116 (+),score=211.00 TRINITY_DN3009_c1_g1_i2:238-3348(+)